MHLFVKLPIIFGGAIPILLLQMLLSLKNQSITPRGGGSGTWGKLSTNVKKTAPVFFLLHCKSVLPQNPPRGFGTDKVVGWPGPDAFLAISFDRSR